MLCDMRNMLTLTVFSINLKYLMSVREPNVNQRNGHSKPTVVKYTEIVNVVLRHIQYRTFTRASLEFHEQSMCR
jgi:hypothetical protein